VQQTALDLEDAIVSMPRRAFIVFPHLAGANLAGVNLAGAVSMPRRAFIVFPQIIEERR